MSYYEVTRPVQSHRLTVCKCSPVRATGVCGSVSIFRTYCITSQLCYIWMQWLFIMCVAMCLWTMSVRSDWYELCFIVT